jgi:DNA polymerase (family 10)
MAAITNRDAAGVLYNVASILELTEDNPYRVRAYRRAATMLMRSDEDANVHVTEQRELDMPGLGIRLRRKLGELFTSGRMKFYVELSAQVPDGVQSLMHVPGIGPKTAFRLHEELGISSAEEVVEAAEAGRIRQLYGFGIVRERQLLEGARRVLGGYVKPFVPLEREEEETLNLAVPSNILPLPWVAGEARAIEAA